MDAVDCALVEFSEAAPKLVVTSSTAWPPALRERLQAVAAGSPIDATAFAVLDAEVGIFLAEAVAFLLRTRTMDPRQITAIGCHGQTVAHAPDTQPPVTLQLGDANLIAERTGIATVNDFRRRDMAAGGQGAPLAPAFHEAMMRNPGEDRIVLNLGGIANITVLPANEKLPVFGFDTGPANCLMDTWTRQHLGRSYDEDGAWAGSASPDPDLLAGMLDDIFFQLQPPKSTGTQYFSTTWLNQRLAGTASLSADRVQATLMTLTCQTVADAVRRYAPGTARVLVCGGGVHNTAMMRLLADTLDLPVESTKGFGIDPDWMEAMAFAWLAQRTLSGQPGNLPAVTGASGPRILGVIHPA